MANIMIISGSELLWILEGMGSTQNVDITMLRVSMGGMASKYRTSSAS